MRRASIRLSSTHHGAWWRSLTVTPIPPPQRKSSGCGRKIPPWRARSPLLKPLLAYSARPLVSALSYRTWGRRSALWRPRCRPTKVTPEPSAPSATRASKLAAPLTVISGPRLQSARSCMMPAPHRVMTRPIACVVVLSCNLLLLLACGGSTPAAADVALMTAPVADPNGTSANPGPNTSRSGAGEPDAPCV